MTDDHTVDPVDEFCREIAKRLRIDESRVRAAVRKSMNPFLSKMRLQDVASQVEAAKKDRWDHDDWRYQDEGYVRILPYKAFNSLDEPLIQVVGRTARQSGYTARRCGLIMSYFIENLADIIAHGSPVNIPGFGKFVAYPCARKGRVPFALPKFLPARTLQKQVAAVTPMEVALRNKASVDFYRQHQHPSSKPERQNASVGKSMELFRSKMQNYSGLPEMLVP
jgi:nucleoid DNA-binding protein